MNRRLTVAAALEAAIGIGLLIDPAAVSRLLLGGDITGAATALGRIAGLGFVSFGLACWPEAGASRAVAPSLRALFVYNFLVTLLLAYLGIGGEWVGVLLWPAVAIHGIMTLLLGRAWLSERRQGGSV